MRLKNKVALITGGTSGIGAITAERFHGEGAIVAVMGRDRKAGDATIARLGDRACFIQGDVSRPDDVAEAITRTRSWGGRLDVLFNNAGGLTTGGVETFTEADFDHAIRSILGSVLYGIKFVAPIMKEQKSGSIINNSSVAALRTHLGGYLYSVAKAAVSHATRLAGMELGAHGVTVNSISPGAVATPIFFGGSRVAAHMKPDKVRALTSKLIDHLAAATPASRAGVPEDVAAAAVFLASDEARYVNCHDLVVDGGLSAAGRNIFDPSERFDPLGGAERRNSQ